MAVEPDDIESIVRHLVAIAVHQDAINERLASSTHRLDTSIAGITVTLEAIKDLLERGQNGR